MRRRRHRDEREELVDGDATIIEGVNSDLDETVAFGEDVPEVAVVIRRRAMVLQVRGGERSDVSWTWQWSCALGRWASARPTYAAREASFAVSGETR